MKKKFIILSVIFFMITSCQEVMYNVVDGEAQGTTYHIIYNKDELLRADIDSILNIIDLSVSNYNDKSILYRVNNNEDVQIDNHFLNVFRKATEISEASEGYFDITVGPLVNLYGFGNSEKGNITDTIVDSLLQYVGYNKVKIKGDKVVKENPNILIDMNALAQGYSVDYVADFFERRGVSNYLIEIGGEVIISGKDEFNEGWRVGIEKPIEHSSNDREIELILSIKNEKKGIATSGNYRKFHIDDGIKYTHTINPKTGRPVRDSLVSVTILADDCMTADGYATACLVSGFEKAKEIVENDKNLEAFLIYLNSKGNYQFYFTPEFKKYVLE